MERREEEETESPIFLASKTGQVSQSLRVNTEMGIGRPSTHREIGAKGKNWAGTGT